MNAHPAATETALGVVRKHRGGKRLPGAIAFAVCLSILAACAPETGPTATPTPTATPFAPEATAAPARTATASATVAPTAAPTATEPSPPKVLAAYVLEGNLYLQDSGGPPRRLTAGGADRRPMLTPDGRQVVFFRGRPDEIYRVFAIDADGNRERPLLTPETLAPLGPGYGSQSEADTLAFLPGTNRLLFSTQIFAPLSTTVSAQECCGHPGARVKGDLLFADPDTAEIRPILPPGSGYDPLPSPDGTRVALWAGDQLDVFDLGGRRIRDGLLAFRPDWKSEALALAWTGDSTALILVAPRQGTGDPTDGPEPNGVWRYPVGNELPSEIRLKPEPISWEFAVSPDGGWIAYDYYYYPGKTDESAPAGIYLGNLRAGTAERIEGGGAYGVRSFFTWSPGSVYFCFGGEGDGPLYVVDRDGQTRAQDIAGGIFLGWVDDARFLYAAGDSVRMKPVGGDAELLFTLPEKITSTILADFAFVSITDGG
jgi:hypothetical protein